MPTNRRLALLIAVLTAVPALAVPATAAATPQTPRIDWKPCGAEHPGFDCADVPVPLDYDKPRGQKITVALARKPATDKANRIGSLFVNPGGPGGSGVRLAFGAGDLFSAATNGRFDIVGFDPRGIGRSTPIHCFESSQDWDTFLAGLPEFPYQAAQERKYYDTFRSLGAKCRDDEDRVIAAHMSTADVVRDLDLLRRAVGDDKLSFLGWSYGSFIGTTYANLFPRNIRAMVIDGVLNPELWSSGRQVESDKRATDEVWDEFLRLCDEAGTSCQFHTPQGAKARWQKLLDTVRHKPVVVGDTTYTYDKLVTFGLGTTYSTHFWREDGVLLDQIADAAESGAVASASGREPDYGNGFDASFGNMCADTQYPHSFAGYKAIGRYAATNSTFGPAWWWINAGCADWPVAEDRYTGPWHTRTNAPVLVVGNHFDPATDYRGAQAVAKQLKNSRLLTYAGWGHTAYLDASACIDDHVNRYLLSGTLPPAGTVCAAEPNPFLRTVSAQASPKADLLRPLS